MNPLMTFDEFRTMRVRWHGCFLSDDAPHEERKAITSKMEEDVLAEWEEWQASRSPLRRKMQELAWQHEHTKEFF